MFVGVRGYGGLVVTMFALHIQGWGFESCLHPLCVEFAYFPHAMGVSSAYSSFLSQSKDWSVSVLHLVSWDLWYGIQDPHYPV